jgi:hypothetical protein
MGSSARVCERFEDCDSQRRSRIERFVCPRCGRTLSVLPKNRLPYIAVNTTILESDFDARASGTDPPGRSEKERGRLRRAFEPAESLLYALYLAK